MKPITDNLDKYDCFGSFLKALKKFIKDENEKGDIIMKREENICKNCKHFREILGADVVFIERIEMCDRLNMDWPFEKKCECFEHNEIKRKEK